MRATWPFAYLQADARTLEVSCLGSYSFKPKQVWDIEAWGSFLGGVRIRHNRDDYPDEVTFYCFGSGEKLRERILDVGFFPSGLNFDHPQDGSAWRLSFVLASIVGWNLLFFAATGIRLEREEFGPAAIAAFAVGLAWALAVLFLPGIQRLALRQGRDVGEVRSTLVLTALVMGCMLFISALSSV